MPGTGAGPDILGEATTKGTRGYREGAYYGLGREKQAGVLMTAVGETWALPWRGERKDDSMQPKENDLEIKEF